MKTFFRHKTRTGVLIALALILAISTFPLAGCGEKIEVSNPLEEGVFTLDGAPYQPTKKGAMSDEKLQEICKKSLEYAKDDSVHTLVVKNWSNYTEDVLAELLPLKDTITEIQILENSEIGYSGKPSVLGEYTSVTTLIFEGRPLDLDIQLVGLAAMPQLEHLSIPLTTDDGLEIMQHKGKTKEQRTVSTIQQFYPNLKTLATKSSLSSLLMDVLAVLPQLESIQFDTSKYPEYDSGSFPDFVKQAAELKVSPTLKQINGLPAESWSIEQDISANPDIDDAKKERFLDACSVVDLIATLDTFSNIEPVDAKPTLQGKVYLAYNTSYQSFQNIYDDADDSKKQSMDAIFPSSRFASPEESDFVVLRTTNKSIKGYWHYEGTNPSSGTADYNYSYHFVVFDMKNKSRYVTGIEVAGSDPAQFLEAVAALYQA